MENIDNKIYDRRIEKAWDAHFLEYVSGERNDRPVGIHPNPMHASNFLPQ